MSRPYLRIGAALAGAAFFVPDGSAIVRRNDVPQDTYKNLASQTQFAAVGRIDFDYGDGFQGAGSGTLIGSNKILSAGHMFDRAALDGVIGIRFVLGSTNYSISLTAANSFTVHPGYDPDTLENDLSIAFLTTSSSVTPAALFSSINLQGLTTTMVGYGMTGTGTSGSTTYDGIKRAGTNVIDLVTTKSFEVDFDNPASTTNALGSATATAMEAMIGPGDSGGSAWVQVNGQWGIVGVTSYGIDENESNGEDGYGDIGGFVNVASYLPWIQSFGPVTVVPEPSALALLGLGMGIGLVVRRRR